MIYASPGVGKTVFVGTATDLPNVGKILYLDTEGNTDSIESKCHYVKDGNEILKPTSNKINVVRIKSYDQFLKILGVLEDSYQKGNFPYSGGIVAIDSYSELDEMSLRHAMKISGILPSKRGFPDAAMIPEYGISRTALKNAMYKMKEWDCHLIVTCKVYKDEEKDSPTFNHIFPSMYGKLKEDIPGLLKQVGYLSIVNNRRCLRFYPTSKTYGKDCSEGGKLSKDIFEPTMKMVFDLRYGK
jgi:hypothetical protein